ncbi:MAG: YgjV family protein [Oscillospiraceae bacterium]|nr:YgjV family protein [Oscillospiraceae bacterium]
MEPIEIIAQAIGIVAMVFNILSYQGKKQKTVITLQLFGGLLFAVNFWMIGAKVGGILNVIAVIRALIFLFKDKLKANSVFWLIGFILSYIVVYILTFTTFGTELTPWTLIRELLPVIGMTALSVGFRLKDAANIRKYGLVSSPAWLIYNIAVGSWGAIICETLTLISIFVGMFRHDKKPE